MFGEIMYGGHITDHWDRRTCTTYLQVLMRDELFEEMELGPRFPVPPPGNYVDYTDVIRTKLPGESPVMFGLHPNAEIGFLTHESEMLFSTIITLRGGISSGVGMSKEEKVRIRIEEIMQPLPDIFDLNELASRGPERRTPYVNVVLQECERMNVLLLEIKNSLRELQMGLDGELTISESMDDLLNSIFYDRVPDSWAKVAYPSLKSLGFWLEDLLKRIKQLEEWSEEMQLPRVVWLSGLFNPMSFLTAIMQTTARRNALPLDNMCLQTEVLKKHREEITHGARDGCYIDGLFLEGAAWDEKAGVLRQSNLKELVCKMPVIHIRAVTVDKSDTKSCYIAPVYNTSMRGPTYIFSAQLKTKDDPNMMTLAGVALLLSV